MCDYIFEKFGFIILFFKGEYIWIVILFYDGIYDSFCGMLVCGYFNVGFDWFYLWIEII